MAATSESAADFLAYREAFSSWDSLVGDLAQVPTFPEGLIHADPPYDVGFTKYAEEAFAWADQVRLAGWLARHPGPVILSNGDRSPAREVLALRNC